MNVLIKPSILRGQVSIPSSKSISHRAIIAAFLSKGKSIIKNVSLSKDIEATLNAINSLGGYSKFLDDTTILIEGYQKKPKNAAINCFESGTTLRFFIPISSALGCKTTFLGEKRLIDRPLYPYISSNLNITIDIKNKKVLAFDKLKSGEYHLDGNISSQFISGLLFSLPLLKGDSKIILNKKVASKPYIDLTLKVLFDFGIEVFPLNDGFYIKGNQTFKARDYFIEGDWSQASFFEVMGTKCDIAILGLNPNSLQGDKKLCKLINTSFNNGKLTIKKNRLNGFEFSAWDTPDLVPALSVLASISNGTSLIYDINRLKYKESNRLNSIMVALNKIGAKIRICNDKFVIQGVPSLSGGIVDSFDDHRIVMAVSSASVFSKGDIKILNAQACDKSYPNFFRDFSSLGGNVSFI